MGVNQMVGVMSQKLPNIIITNVLNWYERCITLLPFKLDNNHWVLVIIVNSNKINCSDNNDNTHDLF